jgi:hypothetical protein
MYFHDPASHPSAEFNASLRFIDRACATSEFLQISYSIRKQKEKEREREREKERGGHDELAYEGVSRLVRGHIAGQVASNDPLYRNLHLI